MLTGVFSIIYFFRKARFNRFVQVCVHARTPKFVNSGIGSGTNKGKHLIVKEQTTETVPQIFHRMTRQRKCNTQSPTSSYKYSFRLNEEQEIRFRQLLAAAGLEHNYSRFIVKRLFAERFEVIRRDPSKVEFLTRLNDLYFQFQRVGNNYNQVSGPLTATSPMSRFPARSPCWNSIPAN